MNVGGQAVIEGVMMRNKDKYAVAVRLKNGKIKVLKQKSSYFPKMFNIFFIRGVVGLGYTLYDGVRALIWSGNQNLGKEEKMTKKEVIGTIALSFLFSIFFFIVLLLSILVFTLIPGAWWMKLLGRILLIPVIAGVGYEIIKLSARFQKNPLVKIVIAPGLWLQRITTKEPTDRQLEVGIKALRSVIG